MRSDGKFVYVFRQSINIHHEASLFAKMDDGSAVVDQNGNPVPIVNDTLLVDRFVLAGTHLSPKREVRFKRSRNKHRPQGHTDSLGAKDMNDQPFIEPTKELDFVSNLHHGRFTVLLLPTQIAEIQRWQIFTHNDDIQRVDSFNIERSDNGLFNTKGTTFYTSPDSRYQKSILERAPGVDPFTGQPLVPISLENLFYCQFALKIQSIGTVNCGPRFDLATKTFTIECWLKKTDPSSTRIQNYLYHGSKDSTNMRLQMGFQPNGNFRFSFWNNDFNSSNYGKDTEWHHWSC